MDFSVVALVASDADNRLTIGSKSMDYVQITAKQREEMLKAVGANRIDDLLKQVPDQFRLTEPLKVPEPMDELSLRAHLADLAAQNQSADQQGWFLGAGFDDHFIPI